MRFLIAALVLWVALTSGAQADYMARPLCEQLTLPRAVGCEDSADGPSIYVIAPPVVTRSRPGKLFINLWPDPAPPDELIVDASGGGACDMISAAVAAAAEGATIRVQPGTYRESITVEKPLNIIGDGPRDEIVIEYGASNVITLRAASGRLAGMTVRMINTGTAHTAIWIAGGEPILENLDLNSAGGYAVYITGSGTAPILRRNHIHDSKYSGISINGGAGGQIEGNIIFGNYDRGIAIFSRATPTVTGNTIIANGVSAIYRSSSAGLAVIRDNITD